ncbi:MAG: nucleotidyltransferase family protein [Bacteroidota bacterium]
MKKNLEQILSEIRALFDLVQNKYDVENIEVFGSYARSDQKRTSDVDLLVTFKRTPSLIQFIGLENFLSDNLGIKVDLVMKDSLRDEIKGHIIKEAVPIYK